MRKKIIIDTDPGHDDAIALMIAMLSSHLEILGVTTVAGNVPVDLTTKNALKICELLGREDINVFSGSKKPLERELVTAEYVHGKSGLDGPLLPEPKIKEDKLIAHEFIIQKIEQYENKSITICALGPLTNIAKVIISKPQLVKKIKEIILMGGSFFEGGNITQVAEFNIFVDPEAAKIVFDSNIPITMFPLDVTHKVLATKDYISNFKNVKNTICKVVHELLTFFSKYDMEKHGFLGAPLHDTNVIIYILKPELYKWKYVNVDIETISELTLGMTVVDWWDKTKKKKNAKFVYDANVQSVLQLILEKLKSKV